MSEREEADYKDLVRQYDEMRQREMDFVSKRHEADLELQKIRFEIKRIADRIVRTNTGIEMPCW